MTLQDLKNNQPQIINHISAVVNGDQNWVSEVLESMESNVSYTSCEDVENFADERMEEIGVFDLFTRPRKESKLAAMMAAAHEGEEFNPVTKEWEKI
jgi:hypothetical protein